MASTHVSPQISPDDPRLHTLETERPVVLRSEHALTLLALGLESKAYDLETCGKRKRKKRCDDDHQHRETITCKQRMHWFCAAKLATEHLERILAARQFALLKASPGRPGDFQYIQLTVPIQRDDEAYFNPLQDLKAGGTRVFLGVVNSDGLAGAKRRAQAASKYLKDFGISAECGFGRELPERIPELLKIHREVADSLMK